MDSMCNYRVIFNNTNKSMNKEKYINALFEQLDLALMEEAKARSKTRRIVLELRKTVNTEQG